MTYINHSYIRLSISHMRKIGEPGRVALLPDGRDLLIIPATRGPVCMYDARSGGSYKVQLPPDLVPFLATGKCQTRQVYSTISTALKLLNVYTGEYVKSNLWVTSHP